MNHITPTPCFKNAQLINFHI